MRHFCLCILSSIIIVSGCSKQTIDNGNVEIIPIDYSQSEKLSMEDVFSKIEVIGLEGNSDSYVRNVDDLIYKDGYYYIVDNQSIVAFDSVGKYCYNSIKRNGRGHNEYISLNGWYIEGGDIYIMDNSGTVKRYDSLLNLKHMYSVPMKNVYYYSEIERISDDIVVLSSKDKDLTFFWNFYSLSGNEVVGSFKVKNMKVGGIGFGGYKRYIRNDNQVLYRFSDNGYTLYRIDENDFSLKEAYKYSVNKDVFDPSQIDDSEKIGNYLVKHHRDFIVLMDSKINNNMLVSKIGYIPVEGTLKGDVKISFYSIKSGVQRLIDNKFTGNKFINTINYLDDTAIYTAIIVNSVDNLQNMYDDKLLDDSSRKILEKVDETTNVLIFKYSLRSDILQ